MSRCVQGCLGRAIIRAHGGEARRVDAGDFDGAVVGVSSPTSVRPSVVLLEPDAHPIMAKDIGPGQGKAMETKARRNRIVATFSIVAADLTTGDLGIAVASKFLACGAVVPWAGAGAVATQS